MDATAETGRLEQFVSQLQSVKQTPSGYEARCPAHDDKHASLSVGLGKDGRILVHCHAGCSVVQVCQAMQVPMSSLFPRSGASKIERTYDYVSAEGELLYQVVRFAPKDFRQRKPDGQGGWNWSTRGVPKILYRLPELLAADPQNWVFVVEGEKDVEAIIGIGGVATCNPGGAGKWARLSDDSALEGRRVCIVADNDGPGRAHAADVAARLRGRATEVRILSPGAGKDVADWINRGLTLEQLYDAAEAATESLPSLPAEAASEPAVPGVPGDEVPNFQPHQFKLDLYGNVDRFIHAYGQNVLWCQTRGTWYVWDGRVWTADDRRQVERMAELTVRGILKEAAGWDGDEALKWAYRCNKTASARKEMLDAVKHRRPAVSDQFDRAPMLLGAQNGVIDLRNGELMPHAREHMISQVCQTIYDPDAPCPRWERFLSEIMDGDSEMIAALQRLAGYFLTGDVSVQILPIFYGPGGNGKNVLLDTILGIMGPHAAEAPEGLVTARKNDEHPTEIASLCGRRLVVASENEEGKKLRIGLVKKITGNKYLTGRFMRQDYFQFERTHKTVLVTNNKPVVSETGNAIWRRLRLVPFSVTIPDDKQDSQLVEKLKAEWPGILAWIVRGSVAWWENQCKLEFPEAVLSATAEYRNDNDVVGEFLASKCIDWRQHPEQNMKSPKERVYKAYCVWCRDSGLEAMNRTAFGARLRAEGFVDGTAWYAGRTHKCWSNITLQAEE